MLIKNIIKFSEKPVIYEEGNAVMWTDPYISKQILDIHLNPDIDLGSRKPDTIQNTVNWILNHVPEGKLNILDLGCGPGLYTQLFAGKGHHVTGVDFSKNSIEHARAEADKKGLRISYINKSYLELDPEENQFDLVTLIFTDFGPLLPSERTRLLEIIKKLLKPDGIFIFDVLNDNNLQNKNSPRNWEAVNNGFWKNKPYLALSESYVYEEEKVILYQHIIVDEDLTIDTYRFWTRFFSEEDLNSIMQENGFKDIKCYNNVIPSGDGYESSDVTFCIAHKGNN